MEMKAHQNPSHEPLKKVRGNSFSLNQVSWNTIQNYSNLESQICFYCLLQLL